MFAIKSSGTMRDGEIHMWPGSRARLRALEALAFFIFIFYFFFLNIFGGQLSYFGATGTPVLDFW